MPMLVKTETIDKAGIPYTRETFKRKDGSLTVVETQVVQPLQNTQRFLDLSVDRTETTVGGEPVAVTITCVDGNGKVATDYNASVYVVNGLDVRKIRCANGRSSCTFTPDATGKYVLAAEVAEGAKTRKTATVFVM